MSTKNVTAMQALRIIGMIRTFFIEEGLGDFGHVELHVHDDEDMKDTFGLGVEGNACVNKEINMLRNVPPSRFAEICCHECFHLWHYKHGIFGQGAEIEGCANLMAYLFLQRIGTPGCRACMNNLMTNPDPVYGDGFRNMLDTYYKFGWKRCLEMLKQQNT